MEFFSSAWHFLSATFVFVVGLVAALKFSKKFNCNWRRSIFLYFWHTLFCIVYAEYVIVYGGDAIQYYEQSLSSNIDFSLGTFAIIYLTRLFSHYFDLSFLGVFFVYNIFGFIGLLAFDASLRHVSYDKSKIARFLSGILIFLPSVSFWSAAIGKDSLSFMATGLALWAAIEFNRRVRLMIFSIILMLFVRPHMAGLMTIALSVSMISRGQISIAKKSALIVASFAAVAVAVPFALEYSGVGGSYSATDFSDYVEQRQSYNQEGGGGVDISAMSLPMQLFTYVFRPLPFEAKSIFEFAASFDNIILILVFSIGVFGLLRNVNSRISIEENRVFMWLYSLSAWLVLAITTANLGISVRQKWMFVPILVFLFTSRMTKRKQIRGIKQNESTPVSAQSRIK